MVVTCTPTIVQIPAGNLKISYFTCSVYKVREIVFIVDIGVLIISLTIEATGRDVNINQDRGRSPRFYSMIDIPIETVKRI